jgi:hypothetical protein
MDRSRLPHLGRNSALSDAPLRFVFARHFQTGDYAMRQPLIATTLILTIAAAVMVAPDPGRAQGKSEQIPLPPGGFKPPPMAPIKPFQPVAVAPPAAFGDASFVAFRKQLGDIAQHKDRAALAKLVVAQGFIWMQDKDLADKRKSGAANLANAIDLDAKDGSGWEVLSGYATEPTGEPLPDRQNVICAPAEPGVDGKAFEALIEATQTQPPDWAYPLADGLEMRSAGKPGAPVVEKLGLTLVRVLPDNAPPDDAGQPPFLHIAAPSGKSGFVPLEAISALGGDQMCYTKDAGAWKITGYFGGAAQ